MALSVQIRAACLLLLLLVSLTAGSVLPSQVRVRGAWAQQTARITREPQALGRGLLRAASERPQHRAEPRPGKGMGYCVQRRGGPNRIPQVFSECLLLRPFETGAIKQ